MYFNNETDLLIELIEKNKLETSEYKSIKGNKKNSYICAIESFEIKNKKQADKLNRPIGEYRLITIKDIKYIEDRQLTRVLKKISGELKDLMGDLTEEDSILVVGLGNEKIESDSLGKKVINNIVVTRGFDKQNNLPKVSAIAPSVMGETGIETSDIVEAICRKIKPNKVIVVDSLCATSYDRLGKSIQITNVGLIPGGGIKNPKKAINKKLLGCDVITIGIPLMIFASSINKKILEDNKDLVVTFHDIDFIVSKLSKLIANAINYTILGVKSL